MTELLQVEIPAEEFLRGLGYEPLSAEAANRQRESLERVLLRETLIEALMEINEIPLETARSVYNELANIDDNEEWFKRFRGDLSRRVEGESTSRTIRVLDLDRPERNRWQVVRQLTVKGANNKWVRPDLVVFVNGIPLVVIEAKNLRVGVEQGIAQIRRYEREAGTLFLSNAFNIATTGSVFRYGATGSSAQFWFDWPESTMGGREFAKIEAMERGFRELLSPKRLLDIIAHFIVFERDREKVVKKICRYQQLRAVNKMVDRVLAGEHRQGLIWHTQGSGKSLTMVFGALKFKFHRGIDQPQLTNPNILVVTDRRDLDSQITSTFRACGLPNPQHVQSISELRAAIGQQSPGRVITTTIFKFEGDDERLKSKDKREREAALKELAIEGSEQWILLIDECHRTQEELLGAYLRATFPKAFFFGFTGTPVKKNDKDTFTNFSAPGEGYLDKYGIDEAVRDGATVPVFYTARMSQWHLEEAELDEAFERYFAAESEETRRKLKERGVSRNDLARLPSRIGQIAADLWEHYQKHIKPEGYKAQVVAVDRRAVAEYKKALDEVIAGWYVEQGLAREEAVIRAARHSAAIYSGNANDKALLEEDETLRDVVRYQLSEAEEREAIKRFCDPETDLYFLIVCDKLLTGFDAPVEQVMYLDKSLSDHNLLQAIARTNRRFGGKPYGLIVDYFGVFKNLQDALSAYRSEDVQGAAEPEEYLLDVLRDVHREVMAMVDPKVRGNTRAAVLALGSLDRYYEFRRRGKEFLNLYGAVMPDPAVILYAADVKLVGDMIAVGKQEWELEEADFSFAEYGAKLRQMLEEHVEVTGIRELYRLKSLNDPEFWGDFKQEEEPRDLDTAAVRKTVELKKAVSERMEENPERYALFSERLRELIASFQLGLFDDGAKKMEALEDFARDLQAEEEAQKGSRLDERTYGIWAILKATLVDEVEGESEGAGGGYGEAVAEAMVAAGRLRELEELAEEIAAIYESEEFAPIRWQEKDSVRQELRQQVRMLLIVRKVRPWKGLPEKIESFALKNFAKS